MKWLGGLAGLLFGFSVGRFENALGWMLGGLLAGGALDFFRQPRNAAPVKDSEAESARIFKALGDIHWRLKRLEEQASLPASPMERDVAAPVVEGETALAAGSASDIKPAAADIAPTAVLVDRKVAESIDHPMPVAAQPEIRSEQPAPVAPDVLAVNDSLFELARRWFFGGNTVLKAGIIILFFGVAFLIKYAADSGVLPIELRLAGVAAGGIALLVTGFRLRNRADGKAAYGLALQGAGIGILYLAIFGAFRFYHLLPGAFAFVLMVAVVGLSAALAVMQKDRKSVV